MGLTFDGVDIESTYGIIIDGASSWPKPERDVEYIHVPGRSGDILMDNGCWQNVEISYNLCITGDWKTAFEDFAAWLCSHNGYFRLEDLDRHPGVYRMASFSGPLDPELWFTTDTGVFTVTFNCKPQQWLLEGETPITYDTTLLPEWVVPSGEPTSGAYEEYSFAIMSDVARRTPLVYITQPSTTTIKVTNNSDIAKDYVFCTVFQAGPTSSTYPHSARYSTTRTAQPGESLSYSSTSSSGAPHYVCVAVYCADGIVGDTLEATFESGTPVEVTVTPNPLINPTLYNSFPLIKVQPVDDGGEYTINAHTISIAANDLENIYIDCDLEDCYEKLPMLQPPEEGTGSYQITNANEYVTINKRSTRELRDFPYLKPGENVVELADYALIADPADFTAKQLIITPNWYRI